MKSFFTKSKIKNKLIDEIINSEKTNLLILNHSKKNIKKILKKESTDNLLQHLVALGLIKNYRKKIKKSDKNLLDLIDKLDELQILNTKDRHKLHDMAKRIRNTKDNKIKYNNIIGLAKSIGDSITEIEDTIYEETIILINKFKLVKDQRKTLKERIVDKLDQSISNLDRKSSHRGDYEREKDAYRRAKEIVNTANKEIKGGKSSNKVYIGQRGGRYIIKNGTKRYL